MRKFVELWEMGNASKKLNFLQSNIHQCLTYSTQMPNRKVEIMHQCVALTKTAISTLPTSHEKIP